MSGPESGTTSRLQQGLSVCLRLLLHYRYMHKSYLNGLSRLTCRDHVALEDGQ